jgi:hypothetical protein
MAHSHAAVSAGYGTVASPGSDDSDRPVDDDDRHVNLYVTALVAGAAISVTFGILFLVRRYAPAEGIFLDGGRAAGVFAVLATGFSVLFGFVVLLSYTSYDTARQGARSEATDVIQQFETAQLLPAAVRAQLSGELICYGRAVIGIEWPLLRAGKPVSFNPWGIPLFERIRATSPRIFTEQTAYSKWLDQTSNREQSRLDRVQAAEGVVPTPLWVILLVMASLVYAYTFLFADPRERLLPQAAISAMVTLMLVTSLIVTRFLDDPYRTGAGSLRPTEMQHVLAGIDTASRRLGIHVHAPCDPSGHPIPGG